MKTAIVLMLLIATVYCLPVKRPASSSESSEEQVVIQRPAPILRKAAVKSLQAVTTQTTPSDSNESTDSADDTEETEDTSETDDNDTSESNSGETGTSAPPTVEPTLGPEINTGRGDSLGYPSDYKKSIVYVDAKEFEKVPSPYKSYSSEKMGGLKIVSKKSDDQSANDVEKGITLYKALQVHDVLLEDEDTSTPEVDNTASGTEEDMGPSDRQAGLGSQEITSVDNQGTEGSDSEVASAGNSPSASASTSQEEESDSSPSSEETTATPGAADSESDSSQSTESQESDSDEVTNQTTDAPIIIAAK